MHAHRCRFPLYHRHILNSHTAVISAYLTVCLLMLVRSDPARMPPPYAYSFSPSAVIVWLDVVAFLTHRRLTSPDNVPYNLLIGPDHFRLRIDSMALASDSPLSIEQHYLLLHQLALFLLQRILFVFHYSRQSFRLLLLLGEFVTELIAVSTKVCCVDVGIFSLNLSP
jgi:hypothetical protein